YHSPERVGYFSLLYGSVNGKRQQSYPLTEMPQVLEELDSSIDTWMSQAEFFRPNRRVVNLSRIGLLFVDLDVHTLSNLRNKTPEGLTWALYQYCQQEGIPPPSLVLFSGRGLYGKWLLTDPLPRQALPRWNACQRELVSRLNEFGADTAAKDASRVLRVVNTVNSRSGEHVRVLHVHGGTASPLRYKFEELCDALLP
ncbi:replication protein, partial [Endozoicomonas sp. SM1973]|nr:replication protein [Spartinivicinus marinus]